MIYLTTNLLQNDQVVPSVKDTNLTRIYCVFCEAVLFATAGYAMHQSGYFNQLNVFKCFAISTGTLLAIEAGILLTVSLMKRTLKKVEPPLDKDDQSFLSDSKECDNVELKQTHDIKHKILETKQDLTNENIALFTLPLKERYELTPSNLAFRSESVGGIYHGDCNLFYPEVYSTPNGFAFQSTGMSLLVQEMEEKYKVKDRLSVAYSVDDFLKTLQLDQDFRKACIIGNGDLIENEQVSYHKFCVGIEKTGKEVKVVILESQAGGLEENKVNSMENKEFTERNKFTEHEHFSESIVQIYKKLNKDLSLKIYITKVQREQVTGCAAFALQDARNFLNDPEFFNTIENSGKLYTVKFKEKEKQNEKGFWKDVELTYYEIYHLNPAYMIGTQSMKLINSYIKETPGIENWELPGRKKTLSGYLDKYSRQVKGKKQNHYITYKMASYLEKIVALAETQEVQPLVDKVKLKLIE